MAEPDRQGTLPGSLVDVVVVAYNSADTLADCVAPFAQQRWTQVTVVDNASPDDCASIVAGTSARLIRAAENRGFAAGCNLGVAGGRAPWILLLNPDATIAPDAVRALVAAGERHAAAVVGPRILGSDGRLAWSQRRFARIRSTWSQALFLHRIAPAASWVDEVVRDPGAYERAHAAEWLSGACLLIRRDVYEQLGGIDEHYFLYCEDMDLCRRVGDAGHNVWFEPAAVARHIGGASSKQGTTLPLVARSRVRYARRHFRPIAVPFEAAGVAVGCVTHVVSSVKRPALRRGHAAALGATLHELRTRAEEPS